LSHQPVLVVVGPTASGKTRLSLSIAKIGDGEIVSADSRQIYRYLEIGTAKPSKNEMEGIPHHCIDIINPDESFSAGAYGKYARHIVSEIHARRHLPIVVGGSGLYIRALVDGIFWEECKDPELREKLKEEAEKKGLNILYQRLCKVDPEAAEKIHTNDKKRIIRALEVYEITGQPISRMQKEKTQPADFSTHFWGLRWPREVLYQRINKRVDTMLEKGLVEEVKQLQSQGLGPALNALDSVGYKEIFAFLQGECSYGEAIEQIKRNTRRFAKKQLVWFRGDRRIRWIDMEAPVDWRGIARQILSELKGHATERG
jgi:tRNA dimethylallyltransferase